MKYVYIIHDMENRILTCHLTCIICRGLSHEKWIFRLYMSLDGHFYYAYVFDGQNGLWRAWHPSNSCPVYVQLSLDSVLFLAISSSSSSSSSSFFFLSFFLLQALYAYCISALNREKPEKTEAKEECQYNSLGTKIFPQFS